MNATINPIQRLFTKIYKSLESSIPLIKSKLDGNKNVPYKKKYHVLPKILYNMVGLLSGQEQSCQFGKIYNRFGTFMFN